MRDKLTTIENYITKHGKFTWEELWIDPSKEKIKLRRAVEYLLLNRKTKELASLVGLSNQEANRWAREFRNVCEQDLLTDVFELRTQRISQLTELMVQLDDEKDSLSSLLEKEEDSDSKQKISSQITNIISQQASLIKEMGQFEGSMAPTKSSSVQLRLGDNITNSTQLEMKLKKILGDPSESDQRKSIAAELLADSFNQPVEKSPSGTTENLLLEG